MSSDKLIPKIYMTQIPGIPTINGETLFYGSWHLLNEAVTCFINREYFACLICLSTSAEIWLRRTLENNSELAQLIELAFKKKIIEKIEFIKEEIPRGKCHNKSESKTTVSLYLDKKLVQTPELGV